MRMLVMILPGLLWPLLQAQGADRIPTVDELLGKAQKTLASTRDYTGMLIRTERIDGKISRQYNKFKFAKPFKVYLGFIRPHKGREVIYVRGWNNGNLKVHNGSFPDLTINLDPRGFLAMRTSHHPITHFGLANIARLAERNLRMARRRGEGEIQVMDGGKLFGRPVWKIDSKLPRGGWFVTAREDETLWDISRRTGQDMHMILICNPDKGYDEADDVDEGDRVFIPRYYGGQSEFYLAKDNGLPTKVVIRDWHGRLYESYEYPELHTNVGLTRKDFDPDNEEYDF